MTPRALTGLVIAAAGLAVAVEAAADASFFTFMRSRIFSPLGMADTTTDPASEPLPNSATFYHRDFIGLELPATVDCSCFAGAGAFLSTPPDLVRFGMATDTGTLLTSATVGMLQTPQLLDSGRETDYGLGWMLDTALLAGERARMAGHASRTLTTSFLTFPDHDLVAVTTNISFADTRSIACGIARIFARHEGRSTRALARLAGIARGFGHQRLSGDTRGC